MISNYLVVIFPLQPVPGDVLRHGDPESAIDMNEQSFTAQEQESYCIC